MDAHSIVRLALVAAFALATACALVLSGPAYEADPSGAVTPHTIAAFAASLP